MRKLCLEGLALTASLLVTVLVGGCGAKFLPSMAGQFDPRTPWDAVLVLEQGFPETRNYSPIGIVMARSRRSTHAIDACRKEAANHGGDAVIGNQVRSREWRCTVLRRNDTPSPPPVVVAPAPPSDPPPPPSPPSKKRRRTKAD